MQEITDYFIKKHEEIFQGKVSKDIAFRISQLNREHREELRNRLFEIATALPMNFDKEKIVLWLQQCFLLISRHSFRFNKIYFSPGYEIQETIYQFLKEAKSSVQLCVFTITDNRLATEIVECFQRGIKVKIITDDLKVNAKGSEILKLKNTGIPIKTDRSIYHMHNKFGIIDGRIAFTGSFNWTKTATKHNQENLLTTSNFDIVRQYQAEFNRLWDTMFWL